MRIRALPALLALFLLVAALGGTFAEPLCPFEQPRFLNYVMVIVACVLLGVSGLVARPAALPLRRDRLILLLSLFYGLVMVRTLAGDPSLEVFLKCAIFVLVFLCARQVAHALEPAAALEMLFLALLAIVGLSIVLVVAMPDHATMATERGNAWTGIYGQKNAFGRQATLLGLLSVLLALHARRKALPAFGVVVAAAGLWFSLSRTAQLLFLVGSGLIVLLGIGVRRLWMIVALLAVTVFAVAQGAILALQVDLALTNEGVRIGQHLVDLTGRVPIWRFSWSLFEQNPVWGAGFDAVWSFESYNWLYDVLGWRVTDSHNGYLDVLAQTGIAGAVLYVAVLAATGTRAVHIALLERRRDAPQSFVASLFILFLLVNITSTHTMEVLSAWQFLFLLAAFHSAGVRTRGGEGRASVHGHFQRRHPVPQPLRIAGRRGPVGAPAEL